MLRFLRKIRKTLLDDGKLPKYLLYALGEVALIVLGILIAVRVSNWNLGEINRVKEVVILTEILEGLKSDTIDIHANIRTLNTFLKSSEILIHQIENDIPYHDSLKLHFAKTIHFPKLIKNDGPYEVLKTEGFDILSNQELRKEISKIYDIAYEKIITWQVGLTIENKKLIDFSVKHFDIVGPYIVNELGKVKPGLMTPNNFSNLSMNRQYMTLLKSVRNQNLAFRHNSYEMIKNEVGSLISEINSELERLNP